MSGPDCFERHNQEASSFDQDNYSSFLTLVATISEDSSEDEGWQQAIAGSVESHMRVVHKDYEFEKKEQPDH